MRNKIVKQNEFKGTYDQLSNVLNTFEIINTPINTPHDGFYVTTNIRTTAVKCQKQKRTINLADTILFLTIPEHYFVINETIVNMVNPVQQTAVYLIFPYNNLYYPSDWYNIRGSYGKICLGNYWQNNINHKYENNNVNDIITYFWNSKFNYDVKKEIYNFFDKSSQITSNTIDFWMAKIKP